MIVAALLGLAAIVGGGVVLWIVGKLEDREDSAVLENRVRRLNRQAIDLEREDIPEPKRGGFGSNDWTVKKH